MRENRFLMDSARGHGRERMRDMARGHGGRTRVSGYMRRSRDNAYDRGYDRTYDRDYDRDYDMHDYGRGRNRMMPMDYDDYDYNDYGYDDYDYSDDEYEQELKKWTEKLKGKDRFGLSKEDIIASARSMGVKFDDYNEQEFLTTYYMVISDNPKISNDPHTYLAMAKNFLEDDDIAVSPSEKLYLYFKHIVKGE